MRIDAAALEPVERVSQRGVARAVRSLERLAGVPASVGSTSTEIATIEDVTSALRGRQLVGVRVAFENGLRGDAVLLVERERAHALASQLPGSMERDELSVRMIEIGNILISGFLDAWANRLSAGIDQRPPSFVVGDGAELVPDGPDRAGVLAVRDIVDGPADVNAAVYLVPDRPSFERVTLSRDGASSPITVERLRTFERLSARGAECVAEHVAAMTGARTRLARHRHRLVPVDRLSNDERVGITVALDDGESGHVAILFDEDSFTTLAAQLDPGSIDGSCASTRRSAIEELGNVMVSGFVDGWADVLEVAIVHSPPTFVRSDVATIVAQLADGRPCAIVLESTMAIGDATVTCDVIAIPNVTEVAGVFDGTTIGAHASPPDVDAI